MENIIFKFVEFCLGVRCGKFSKDGDIQYCIVFQQFNVSSLEEVIKYFLHLSTKKSKQVQAQAHAYEIDLDVKDIEADKFPTRKYNGCIVRSFQLSGKMCRTFIHHI